MAFRTFALLALLVPAVGRGNRIDYEALTAARSVSGIRFAELRRIIDEPRNGITTLDRLLRFLKRRHPALLRNPVLMYASKSLFHASVSPRFPRVIFNDGPFVGAVTGNPSIPDSYDSFESFELTADKTAFERHLVTFENGRAVYDRITAEKRCERCHGTPFRPRWGAYPLWDGAFGAAADRMTAWETGALRSFRQRIGRREMRRYRIFLGRDGVYPPARQDSPNFRLSLVLSSLNFQRIYANLTASPVYRWYRYALYGALIHCADIDTFLPEPLRREHGESLEMTPDELYLDTATINRNEFERRLAHHREHNGSAADALDFDDLVQAHASLRYVLEGQRIDPSIEMWEWSMSHPRGGYTYAFANGDRGLGDFFHRNFIGPLLRAEPTLPSLFEYSRYPSAAQCRDLARRSRELLATMPAGR